ncbi:hypothetical protein IW261DRAFT_1666430 [Armillaria novae-zelandiae]|uniref:Uncharacterized protein n=1 Tax=Armillaria novae-zelandiae TaxID=153914 RepID=A0AA39NV98_9AGAR|nr:hypothetical protein IW261DRAFT_1666430 [Armillaria novae-zelandiae]
MNYLSFESTSMQKSDSGWGIVRRAYKTSSGVAPKYLPIPAAVRSCLHTPWQFGAFLRVMKGGSNFTINQAQLSSCMRTAVKAPSFLPKFSDRQHIRTILGGEDVKADVMGPAQCTYIRMLYTTERYVLMRETQILRLQKDLEYSTEGENGDQSQELKRRTEELEYQSPVTAPGYVKRYISLKSFGERTLQGLNEPLHTMLSDPHFSVWLEAYKHSDKDYQAKLFNDPFIPVPYSMNWSDGIQAAKDSYLLVQQEGQTSGENCKWRRAKLTREGNTFRLTTPLSEDGSVLDPLTPCVSGVVKLDTDSCSSATPSKQGRSFLVEGKDNSSTLHSGSPIPQRNNDKTEKISTAWHK